MCTLVYTHAAWKPENVILKLHKVSWPEKKVFLQIIFQGIINYLKNFLIITMWLYLRGYKERGNKVSYKICYLPLILWHIPFFAMLSYLYLKYIFNFLWKYSDRKIWNKLLISFHYHRLCIILLFWNEFQNLHLRFDMPQDNVLHL